MNEQNYLLGYLINESGEIYSSVYLDSAPDRHKENLRESHVGNDVYNQLWFMSAAEFQEALDNGIAIKHRSYEESVVRYQEAVNLMLQSGPVPYHITKEPSRPGSYQSKAQQKTAKTVWPASNGTYRKPKN